MAIRRAEDLPQRPKESWNVFGLSIPKPDWDSFYAGSSITPVGGYFGVGPQLTRATAVPLSRGGGAWMRGATPTATGVGLGRTGTGGTWMRGGMPNYPMITTPGNQMISRRSLITIPQAKGLSPWWDRAGYAAAGLTGLAGATGIYQSMNSDTPQSPEIPQPEMENNEMAWSPMQRMYESTNAAPDERLNSSPSQGVDPLELMRARNQMNLDGLGDGYRTFDGYRRSDLIGPGYRRPLNRFELQGTSQVLNMPQNQLPQSQPPAPVASRGIMASNPERFASLQGGLIPAPGGTNVIPDTGTQVIRTPDGKVIAIGNSRPLQAASNLRLIQQIRSLGGEVPEGASRSDLMRIRRSFNLTPSQRLARRKALAGAASEEANFAKTGVIPRGANVPMMDSNGVPVLNPNTGEPVMVPGPSPLDIAMQIGQRQQQEDLRRKMALSGALPQAASRTPGIQSWYNDAANVLTYDPNRSFMQWMFGK